MDSRVNRDCQIILWGSIFVALLGFTGLAAFCMWGQA
jgi:hypothetical protein